MNQKIKWILLALLLVAVIAAAAVLYDRYSQMYFGEGGLETVAPQGDSETASETASETDLESPETRPEFSAPDFAVLDWQGNSVRLSDYVGKPIVLNFWATWCYYCTKEMPIFDQMQKKYPEVQFFMVNATDGVRDTVESAKAYIESQGYTFDVFFDTEGQAVNAYSVTGFPITFFIDANGAPVAYQSGMLSEAILEKGISMITDPVSE